jgi:hypothetical protein
VEETREAHSVTKWEASRLANATIDLQLSHMALTEGAATANDALNEALAARVKAEAEAEEYRHKLETAQQQPNLVSSLCDSCMS